MGLLSRFFGQRSAPAVEALDPVAARREWLDTAIAGATRQAESRYLDHLHKSRSFEAAETPAWVESWPTHAAPINDELSRQLPIMRARARGQARNNEWAVNYLLKLDDNVLGEHGIRLQMRLAKRGGAQDKKLNAVIEALWAEWGKDCETSGLSWREVESAALAGLPRDGELLYRYIRGAGRFGIRIQLLDPALLDITVHRDWQGRRVRMGVEIDDDGRPVAYWLRMTRVGEAADDIITVGRHVRIPASQIRHRFIKPEPGQLRGYPWLAAGAQRLWLLADFDRSAAVASSNAAKRQGFFWTPSGEAPQGFADTIVSSVVETAKAAGKELTADELKAVMAAAEKYNTTVPGQFDTLPHGTQFAPFESKWPDINAEGYVRQQLRGWSAARGVSYVSLGNDLAEVNYSSAQVGILAERDHYKRLQADLALRWLHADVLATVLPTLILHEPRLAPSRTDAYLAAATWQPRRWQPVDPVKAAKANETNLALRLTSRRRLILERGEDPDEIAAEIAEEEKLYGPVKATPEPAPAKPGEDE